MPQQMLCFAGFGERDERGYLDRTTTCQVFLIFRDSRLARVEYTRAMSDKTRKVRTLDQLPDFVQATDWRTRCVSRWYLDPCELDLIDFAGLGIDRAVVDNPTFVDGYLVLNPKYPA